MYTPTADAAARAFAVGRPTGDLIHVRRGDTDAWRLDTDQGSFLVKGYRQTTDGQFVGRGLRDQLEVAMAFERLALDAGVEMPEPIPPADPVVGWLTRIDERFFRAYRWIEHRALRPDDDVAGWLGRTMARIHRMRPLDQVGLPSWWRGALWPRATWAEWFTEARGRDRSWARLGTERLPHILEVSARIEALCAVAPDRVTTHGDFKTHNMLMTSNGPVLVDWDSVRVDSAALEAGRVAHIFGAGQLEPIRRILRAYVAAGGDLGWVGPDLFLSVLRHDLDGLSARIRASLGQEPVTWWMVDGQAVERDIGELLRVLPDKVERLHQLASELSG